MQFARLSEKEAGERFEFLLRVLKFGRLPHSIAFGLERLVMLTTSTGSIQDVTAFPKTQTAACLLTSACISVPGPDFELSEGSPNLIAPRLSANN